MGTINWINDASTRYTGAFMTLRAHREGTGSIRLTMYFSAQAGVALGLKRGERLLVGLDDSGQRLYFKPTMFGGNVIKGREIDEALMCAVTLPVQNLPRPQVVRDSEVKTEGNHMSVPFEFDSKDFRGWSNPRPLLAAA